MAKIRNREIPDHLKPNYKPRLTVDPTQHLNFRIQEIPFREQIFKLQRKMTQTKKVILALEKRKREFPSQTSEIEARILKKREIYNWQATRINILNRKNEIQEKKEATQKENLKKEMEMHIKNLEKAKKFAKPVSAASQKDGITPVGKSLMEDAAFFLKKKVDSKSKKVTSNRMKRFSRK